MSEALNADTTLQTLNLGCVQQQQEEEEEEEDNAKQWRKTGNKIGAEGARALSEALKVNTTLGTLDLFGVCKNNSKTKPNNDTTTTSTQNRQLYQ